MPKFTREQIREKMLNRKKRMAKLEIELPGLEELNGELALQALSPGDYEDADELSKDQDGNSNVFVEGGVLIARSVVVYATKERIFEDTDAEWMKQEWDTDVYAPLVFAVKEFSNISDTMYENAKKNFLKSQKQDSVTSSESELEVPGQGKK